MKSLKINANYNSYNIHPTLWIKKIAKISSQLWTIVIEKEKKFEPSNVQFISFQAYGFKHLKVSGSKFRRHVFLQR